MQKKYICSTTYKSDYTPPASRRYAWYKPIPPPVGLVPVKKKVEEKKRFGYDRPQWWNVEKPKEPPIPKVDPCTIKLPHHDCAEATYQMLMGTECKDPNWNKPAAYGCMVNPRLMPAKLTAKQVKDLALDRPQSCFKTKHNRYLSILRYVDPDLYNSLNYVPRDRLFRDCIESPTTYQIDYCQVNEYPEGVYYRVSDMDENERIKARKMMLKHPACEQELHLMRRFNERAGYDLGIYESCDNEYSPLEFEFRDTGHCAFLGNNSHWRTGPIYGKHVKLPVFIKAIDKFGCMRANSIKHKDNCGHAERHCLHQRPNTCGNGQA